MLDFATQKKILDPILKNPKNYLCADCDSISPSWASLDFGVFLCTNCSGAHRGLGPTITRVRSATLDKWQEEWIDNMLIGNSQLNAYWQGDSRASQKKSKLGSNLNEIGRYVFEKYIKKKYVKDSSQKDPLTSYKHGTYNTSKKEENHYNQQPAPKTTPNNVQPQEPRKPTSQPEQPKASNTFSGNLLQFDFNQQPKAHITSPNQQQVVQQNVQNLGQNNGNGFPNINNQYNSGQHINTPKQNVKTQSYEAHDDEDFSDFTEAGSTNVNKANEDFISFDSLLGQQKKPQQAPLNHFNSYQDLKAQNLNVHHPYNPMISQQNLVYQARYQNMQPQQQAFHNPNMTSHYSSHSHNHINPQQPMQSGNFGMAYQNPNIGLVNHPNQYWK